jgi:general stress protein CsbA
MTLEHFTVLAYMKGFKMYLMLAAVFSLLEDYFFNEFVTLLDRVSLSSSILSSET